MANPTPNPAPGFVKNPAYRVAVLKESRRVRVTIAGIVVADSTDALRLEEAGHEPVHYLPEKDVRLDLLRPTAHKTHCPYKGDAAYWSLDVGSGDESRSVENAVWAYPKPYDEMAQLVGYYAFYRSRVDRIEVG